MDRDIPLAVLIKMRDGLKKALQENLGEISPEKRAEMLSNLAAIQAAIEIRGNRST